MRPSSCSDSLVQSNKEHLAKKAKEMPGRHERKEFETKVQIAYNVVHFEEVLQMIELKRFTCVLMVTLLHLHWAKEINDADQHRIGAFLKGWPPHPKQKGKDGKMWFRDKENGVFSQERVGGVGWGLVEMAVLARRAPRVAFAISNTSFQP
jgi:hypothetical protein